MVQSGLAGTGGSLVVADPATWPREVTLRVPVNVAIRHQGREAGSLPLPAGRVLKVRKVEPTRVTLALKGYRRGLDIVLGGK